MLKQFAEHWKSFNPCYNGSGWLRAEAKIAPFVNKGFNPCYNGSGWLSCA